MAGRPDATLEAGLRALQARPYWADAHRHVIAALASLGRFEEAKAAALRFRRIAPAAARVFADRTRRLFTDERFADVRIRAFRAVGRPE